MQGHAVLAFAQFEKAVPQSLTPGQRRHNPSARNSIDSGLDRAGRKTRTTRVRGDAGTSVPMAIETGALRLPIHVNRGPKFALR
jgi:hypothetical protein